MATCGGKQPGAALTQDGAAVQSPQILEEVREVFDVGRVSNLVHL